MTRININPSIARVYVLVGANVINSVSEYLDRVQTLLYAKNNEHAAVDIRGPRWFPRGVDWNRVMFSARIRFNSGQILAITDNFRRELADEWTRQFSYFFGVPKDDEMERIFLFDTHGLFGGKGHFHPEDDERLMAGDPRLNGFSPENIDITQVLEFIDLYFDGKPFPWVPV
jgi:hypothetical protein